MHTFATYLLKTFIFKNLAVKSQIWQNFTLSLAASSNFHLAPLRVKHATVLVRFVWY